MPPDRIEVMYPGVDTARFHPGVEGIKLRFQQNISQEAPVVALIARFQEVKGHEVFQQMARQVALQIPQTRFLVAGENTQSAADLNLRNRMFTRAHSDPLLRERLHYLGFRPDVEAVIAAADVLVCSSHFEGYGVANIEAMACGRPVVSTNRGGPAETIVNGETGVLVEPGDPAALAGRVLALLRDPALRQRMGTAGRARVEAMFSGTANASQFSRRLTRLLEP
jgi:glycosyltransferase involved in cell wall biosynthesis